MTAAIATEQHVTRLDPGPADVAALRRLVLGGARAHNEQFGADDHLNEIIQKPWGYEYRAYVDEYFDLWALHIDAPHSTSIHAHPRKLTYLICLGGQGVTSGLHTEIPIREGTILRIAGGAFHGTRNVGDQPLELIEVEVPRNKYDLLRLHDDYDRAGTTYETAERAIDEHPMRKVRAMPNARMRPRTPDGRFRFELRTGMDVFYRRRREDIFYIPLCVSSLVYAEVDILTGQEGDRRRPATDTQYLAISHRREGR